MGAVVDGAFDGVDGVGGHVGAEVEGGDEEKGAGEEEVVRAGEEGGKGGEEGGAERAAVGCVFDDAAVVGLAMPAFRWGWSAGGWEMKLPVYDRY